MNFFVFFIKLLWNCFKLVLVLSLVKNIIILFLSSHRLGYYKKMSPFLGTQLNLPSFLFVCLSIQVDKYLKYIYVFLYIYVFIWFRSANWPLSVWFFLQNICLLPLNVVFRWSFIFYLNTIAFFWTPLNDTISMINFDGCDAEWSLLVSNESQMQIAQ